MKWILYRLDYIRFLQNVASTEHLLSRLMVCYLALYSSFCFLHCCLRLSRSLEFCAVEGQCYWLYVYWRTFCILTQHVAKWTSLDIKHTRARRREISKMPHQDNWFFYYYSRIPERHSGRVEGLSFQSKHPRNPSRVRAILPPPPPSHDSANLLIELGMSLGQRIMCAISLA